MMNSNFTEYSRRELEILNEIELINLSFKDKNLEEIYQKSNTNSPSFSLFFQISFIS